MEGIDLHPALPAGQLPAEWDVRHLDNLPQALKSGRVLSAVYRLGRFQRATGTPEGYGWRLLVEPEAARAQAATLPEATA